MPKKLNNDDKKKFINEQKKTGWKYIDKDDSIYKKFEFQNFIAEKINHHPEWFNVYKTVEVTLKTHDLKSLSDLDKVLSEKMDFFAK